jgi:hypothetical protein
MYVNLFVLYPFVKGIYNTYNRLCRDLPVSLMCDRRIRADTSLHKKGVRMRFINHSESQKSGDLQKLRTGANF